MYRLLYLGFLLLLPLVSNGQQTAFQDTQRYKKAYKFILASPEFKKFRENQSRVVVFDSIVFQNQTSFLTELSKHWNYKGNKAEKRLLDSLDLIDKQTWHKPYYSSLTANLSTASVGSKACVVVLFSRLYKDMLLADVSIKQKGGAALHDILPMFNQTVRYLLFFGPDEKVKQYHTQLINYN
jgi:hypothetical protein